MNEECKNFCLQEGISPIFAILKNLIYGNINLVFGSVVQLVISPEARRPATVSAEPGRVR